MIRKLAVLGNGNSVHLVRWANSLVDRGFEIVLFTMHGRSSELYESIKTIYLPNRGAFSYFSNSLRVRRALRKDGIEVLHSHYLTGYGLLGTLSFNKRHVISAWGSDIIVFPKKSYLHLSLVKFVISRSERIFVTSDFMYHILVDKICIPHEKVSISPFGVDVKLFHPSTVVKRNDGEFVFGTVKSLEAVYGVDLLIRAFSKLCNSLKFTTGEKVPKLYIYGGGSEEVKLKGLVKTLCIEDKVKFFGKIPNADVPAAICSFDVFCNLSRSESFGVAILEASACGVPVIASNVGGIPEVIKDGVTGILVDIRDLESVTQELISAYLHKNFECYSPYEARQFVKNNYSSSVTGQVESEYYLDT